MTSNKGDEFSYGDSDYRDELDPAVKLELEILNQSATDINRLEKEMDEARAKYQSTFLESSQLLKQFKKKSGNSIKQARPYYELQEAAREAQIEALRSARKFQTSNGVYLAAKETISLAELRLMDDKAASLSAAWQEMLNHALLRVTKAEREKSASEQEHLKRAAVFADYEKKLHVIEKKHKRSIAKARPYFETKKELDVKLQQLKQSVEDLQQAFKAAKQRYSGALKRLEKISDSIHEQRRQKLILMFPREPGVGAEDSKSTSERDPSFPTLPTSDDIDEQDGLYYDSDNDVYGNSSDDDNDGYIDINNDSIFRAKVLTTSLDEDDTSFMTLKHGGKKHREKPLKRTRSLPLYPGCITNKRQEVSSTLTSFGSDGCFIEKMLEKPLVPLSDRSESHAPDGDSLSNEKNIVCDMSSLEQNVNDIHCDVRPSVPVNNCDTFMTRSSKDIFEPAIVESCINMLHSAESSIQAGDKSTPEDVETLLRQLPNTDLVDTANEACITAGTLELLKTIEKVGTSELLHANESFENKL